MSAVDTDVNNYSIEELLAVLELDNPTEQDINNATNKYILKYTEEDNEDMVTFFQDMQSELVIYINSLKEGPDAKNALQLSHPLITNIPVPAISNYNTNTTVGTVNQLKRTTVKKILCFNTMFRDNITTSTPANCDFSLSYPLKNISSLKLLSLEYPCGFYVIDKNKNNNKLLIVEQNTGVNGIVTLPDGNDTGITFPPALQTAINTALGITRFTVTISTLTGRITITNSTNKFLLIIHYWDRN